MNLSIINTVFTIYNLITDTGKRLLTTTVSVFRLCTQKSTWYILDNGQFVDSSYFNIHDKDKYWIYDGTTLIKNSSLNSKKLPFLSFEFKYDNNTINMDEFIENTKFKDTIPPPLPVIMSAFSIFNKDLHPWPSASFTIFDKMGDKKEFNGSDWKIPE